MLKYYKSILIFISFCCTLVSGQALAKDYEAEYQKSAVMLDIINATEAYKQGITGAGVSVGIFDSSVRAEHPEFSGSITAMPTYLEDGSLLLYPDWSVREMQHGSHVAGIVAANRDGVGMHGVAYGAELFTMAIFAYQGNEPLYVAENFEKYFQLYPQVRIVNNSWGTSSSPYYPYSIISADGAEIVRKYEFFTDMQHFMNYWEGTGATAYEMAKYALENPDKVFVWASGNEAFPTGSTEPLLPRYMGSGLSNWLSVGSVDSSQITKETNTGNLLLNSGGISVFSDLAGGAQRWTVFAPGSMIYSSIATDLSYKSYHGTSMAAPVVSGVLALVQQKFPWMTGKQLADTVLSTANSNIEFTDDYIVQIVNSGGRRDLVFTFIGQAVPDNLTKADAQAMMRKFYTSSENTLTDWGVPLSFFEGMIEYDQYAFVGNVDAESIVGQGVVDAGKAIGGIAELDANRMTDKNVINISELGRSDAVEVFDTMGYTAEFSNDISQFKWDDKYHFDDYKTTASGGDPMFNAAAEALNDKNIGILKTGLGHLILSGENTYAGATIVEGGTLSIATNVLGGGGKLLNSDVVVRTGGTLSGNGSIATQVINSGIVAPGMFGLSDASLNTTTLQVENYTQGANGTLQINFDSNANYGKLNATNYLANDGKLVFNPVAGFYSNATNNLTIFTGALPAAGSFSSTTVADTSPTIDFSVITNSIDSYTLSAQRAQSAYSQYANDAASWNLGNALAIISNSAQGDMQNLITALDFSSPNGQEVKKALDTLGPETYNNLGQLGLEQQNNFNTLVMQRLLAQNKAKFIDPNTPQGGIPAGSTKTTPYQVWGQMIGGMAYQGEFQGIDGYTSSHVGLLAGLDYTWESGLITGMHAGIAWRKTTALGAHDASSETESFSFGVHANFAPEQWDGFYAMGQARLGFEQNDMHRTVTIGSYARSNDSEWLDLVGSMLLGGGKDWTMGNFSFGPIAWIEYSFLQRPEISESNGMATSLKIDATHYNSLRSALGFHVGYAEDISEKLNLEFDVLATWQHELLYGNIATTTSFADYSNVKFNSEAPLLGRNTFALQASVRLNHVDNYFAQFDVGGEITDGNGQALNFSLQIGYNF